MSLLGLAIIGRQNEPLYLCDCARVLEEARQQRNRNTGPADPENDSAATATSLTRADDGDADDPFGFREAAKSCDLGQSLSMDHCFQLHAALDRLEEVIETSAAGLPVTKGRTGHWLDLLSELEQSVYGHITATNIKFLVLVQPPVKESDVRLFLHVIHDSFITYTMNPFAQIEGRIQSKRFDQNIREAVRDYEDNRVFEL
jgi:hypothetical protein